jgi:hypothetical protein
VSENKSSSLISSYMWRPRLSSTMSNLDPRGHCKSVGCICGGFLTICFEEVSRCFSIPQHLLKQHAETNTSVRRVHLPACMVETHHPLSQSVLTFSWRVRHMWWILSRMSSQCFTDAFSDLLLQQNDTHLFQPHMTCLCSHSWLSHETYR